MNTINSQTKEDFLKNVSGLLKGISPSDIAVISADEVAAANKPDAKLDNSNPSVGYKV